MDWLEATLNEGSGEENDYIEPSAQELVEMIEAIPLLGEDWRRGLDTLVLPLSLE